MKLIIKSPMQPTLFRQGIRLSGARKGYLAATHLLGYVIGNNSFKAKYNESIVYLIENKKIGRRRNWSIFTEEDGFRLTQGHVTMTSRTRDTFKDNATKYEIIFNNKMYFLHKPWFEMGKETAFLCDSEGEEIASLLSTYKKKPRFGTTIHIPSPSLYTDKEIAFFTVLLNTALFES